MPLLDAARHYREPYLRVRLFPSKWQVRLLTVYCLRRWDLRLLLRDDLVFRRLLANGTNPDWLYATWTIRHKMPRYLLLHFAVVQLFAAHTRGRQAWLGPFMTLVCIPPYYLLRACRCAVRAAIWILGFWRQHRPRGRQSSQRVVK